MWTQFFVRSVVGSLAHGHFDIELSGWFLAIAKLITHALSLLADSFTEFSECSLVV